MACEHPQFRINSTVQRWGKSDNFRLHATVFCVACGKQFEFMGLADGYNPRGVGTSPDKRELYAAIQPATQGIVLRPFSPALEGAPDGLV